MTLHLGACSHEAATFAVKSWHYSRSLPCPPVCRYGAWEDGRYVGCVVFARGANRHVGRPFGLRADQVAELARVALGPHETPTSRVVAVAVRLLRRQCPGLRLLVSFADQAEGHVGVLYQALGWTFVGETSPSAVYVHRGRRLHPRQVSVSGRKRQFGTMRVVPRLADCVRVEQPPKFRYGLALDPTLRPVLEAMRQPYPRRDASEAERTLRPVPPAEGGVMPTRSLHNHPEAWHVG